LIALVGAEPLSMFCQELSFGETVRYQAAPGAGDAARAAEPLPSGRRHRFSKSEFFDRPLPSQAIAVLAANLARYREPAADRRVISAPWGGASNRRPPQATAFAHRGQLFLLEHLIFASADGDAGADADAGAAARRAAHQWVTNSWTSVHRWGSSRV